MRIGRDEEAAEAIESGIRLRPSMARAHGLLGTIHARGGRHEEAIAAFDRACELDAANDTYHIDLLRVYLACGRRDEAMAEFKHLEDRKSPLAAEVIREIYPS